MECSAGTIHLLEELSSVAMLPCNSFNDSSNLAYVKVVQPYSRSSIATH